MTNPSRLHTIYLREETPFWIKSHAVAVFKPEDAIPSFQKFNDGYTNYEWSEYEDLLFLPLLAHFLSEIPRFSSPKLISMTRDIEKRAGLMSDIENFLRQKNIVLPCDHLVGVSLDREDVPDIYAYTLEAAQRAERVAAIFKMDHSTAQKTDRIAAQLTDEEAVDILIYSLLESEGAPVLPRPAWVIQQAQEAMEHVDFLRNNGKPNSKTQDPAAQSYTPRESPVPEPPEYLFSLLRDKKTGANSHLLRLDLSGVSSSIRQSGKWEPFTPGDYWNQKFDVHSLILTPQQRTDIINIFDSGQHEDADFSDYIFIPGQPRKVKELSKEELENYLNSNLIFTDCNGIECSTAPVGIQKPVWDSFEKALNITAGEVWVFRADVLLPQSSNQVDDDLTLKFFTDDMASMGLSTLDVRVKTHENTFVPAVMVMVPPDKMNKDLATDISVSAIMTGRLGIYRFFGSEMTVYTSNVIGYNGKRSFQIVLA